MRKKIKNGRKKISGFVSDFKKFAFEKNVLDLAIAVIIGGAFGKIVTSLVNDIIMPFISFILGTPDFVDLKLIITPQTVEKAEVAIRYGAFLQSFLDFLIIAFFIFLAIRLVTKSRKRLEQLLQREKEQEEKLQKEEPLPAVELTKDQELLTKIVDLLEQNTHKANENK